MAEYSEETKAILDRLKKEGSYIRNAKGNSLKEVNINLNKFHDSFKSLSSFLQDNARAQTAAAASAAKVAQEAAEKSRRNEELSEVTDPRQEKLDDLKMKAALLRAKSDLKNAKGPGLLTKMNDNKVSTAKIVAAVLGAGFLLKPIITGILDDARPGWKQELSDGVDSLKKLKDFDVDKAIENATTQVTEKMTKSLTDAIGKISFSDIFSSAVGAGIALFGTAGLLNAGSYATRTALKVGQYVRGRGGAVAVGKEAVGDQVKRSKDAVKSLSNPPKGPPKQLPLDFSKSPGKFDNFGKDVMKQFTMKQSTLSLAGKAAAPLAAVATIYDAVRERDIAANTEAENIAELLDNDRAGIGSIAVAVGTGAVSGGIVGAATGPGAPLVAAMTALGNGTLAGVNVLYQYVDDAVNDLDQLPNTIEELARKEQKILENKKLTPEERKAALQNNAAALAKARDAVFADVTSLEADIAQMAADLDSGNFAVTNMFGGKMGDKRLTEAQIRKKIEKGRTELLLRQKQLTNTDKARELLQGTRNAELLKLDALIEASILKVSKNEGLGSDGALVDGSTQVAQTIVNNTTNNRITHKYETNNTSGAISYSGGMGMGGHEDGQYVMG